MKNRIINIIMNYGDDFSPESDISYTDAMSIIQVSQSKMEIVENSYLYGHMRGVHDKGVTKMIPLYNIRQISDEEWKELSRRNKEKSR